jgi:N-dimethylarginine dimethylaminohydrolase
LSGNDVMYFPGAFTSAGLDEIRSRIAPEDRIEITAEDGFRLAANAVCVEGTVLVSSASERLKGDLEARGYRLAVTPLDSFLRSGGSAFCLTLRLDRSSTATPAARNLVA